MNHDNMNANLGSTLDSVIHAEAGSGYVNQDGPGLTDLSALTSNTISFAASTVYPTTINFRVGEGWLKIHADGRAEIPHGIANDEASMAFFNGLQEMGFRFIHEEKDREIARLRERIKQLEAASGE
jgi:hypothetical protein